MDKIVVTSAWGAGYPQGGGLQWLNLHYLTGLRALGFEPGQGPPDRVDVSVLGANASAATGQR